jgi:hypothetical protein
MIAWLQPIPRQRQSIGWALVADIRSVISLPVHSRLLELRFNDTAMILCSLQVTELTRRGQILLFVLAIFAFLSQESQVEG